MSDNKMVEAKKELWAALDHLLSHNSISGANDRRKTLPSRAKQLANAMENLKRANVDKKPVFLVLNSEGDKLVLDTTPEELAQAQAELKAAKTELENVQLKLENMDDNLATRNIPDENTSSQQQRSKAATDSQEQEFSSFLSSIGESVVASQENLDKESINYLKRLQENDTHASVIPPTVFRIPKLKASLKLGIERSSSKKLNVLIFGKEEESKTINQQSVELEIMAVPASAELLHNLEGKIPRIQFVLSPREREFLFEKVKTAFAAQETDKKHYGDMLKDERHRNRVIFWRTTKSTQNAKEVFLVLYAGTQKLSEVEKSHQVGLWQLKLTARPSMQHIIRYDLGPRKNTNQDLGLLYDFVTILAKSQEDLLKG